MIRRPPSVRVATPADIEPLYWMLLRDLEADNPMGVSVSPRKVFGLVQRCCTGDGAVAGIIEGRGVPIASVGIATSQMNFSDAYFLQQLWLFVPPHVRKGAPQHAAALFKFCMWHKGDMSRRLGYDLPLEISVMSRKRLGAKLRLWGRYGEMVGGIFWARGTDEHGQSLDNHSIDATVAGTPGGIQRDTIAGR